MLPAPVLLNKDRRRSVWKRARVPLLVNRVSRVVMLVRQPHRKPIRNEPNTLLSRQSNRQSNPAASGTTAFTDSPSLLHFHTNATELTHLF